MSFVTGIERCRLLQFQNFLGYIEIFQKYLDIVNCLLYLKQEVHINLNQKIGSLSNAYQICTRQYFICQRRGKKAQCVCVHIKPVGLAVSQPLRHPLSSGLLVVAATIP
jgi:hypothetical protein